MRPVLLAVVLGIALMHHLGGASHAGCTGAAMPASMSASMPMSVSTSVPAGVHGSADQLGSVPAKTPASTDVGGLLHLCLAILTAAAAALVLVVLGLLGATSERQRTTPRPPDDGHCRAPPGPRRLAALQVLRI